MALKDKLTVGSRVIIAHQAELRGEIGVGSGTVIHPQAVIMAVQGPIQIGSDCIIDEMVTIINRGKTLMRIGDNNHFEVACRIESPRIGSNNTFMPRSKVSHTVSVGSFCTVGAGCTLRAQPSWPDNLDDILAVGDESEYVLVGKDGNQDELAMPDSKAALSGIDEGSEETPIQLSDATPQATKGATSLPAESVEEIPDRTVVWGAQSSRRLWSGEGVKQEAALHAKHLEYLRDMIPRFHKLKMVV